MNTGHFLKFAEKEKGSDLQIVQKYLKENKCTYEESVWMLNVLAKKKQLITDLQKFI